METVSTKDRKVFYKWKCTCHAWQSCLVPVMKSSLHPHRLSRQNFLERTADLQYHTLSPEKRSILMTHPSPSLRPPALRDLPPHWPLHVTCSHTSLRWDLHYLGRLTCQNGSSCRPRLIQSLSIITAKRCSSPWQYRASESLPPQGPLYCWFWRTLWPPVAVDLCEMLSIDSLEPGINTERRGHVLAGFISLPLALSLRWAPRFPLGRLSGLSVWPTVCVRDTAGPFTLSLIQVMSQLAGGQRMNCPEGVSRKGPFLLLRLTLAPLLAEVHCPALSRILWAALQLPAN